MKAGIVAVRIVPLEDGALRNAGLYGRRRVRGHYRPSRFVELVRDGDHVWILIAKTRGYVGRLAPEEAPRFVRMMESISEKVAGPVTFTADLHGTVDWGPDEESTDPPEVMLELWATDPLEGVLEAL